MRVEDLDVFKKSHKLVSEIYSTVNSFPKEEKFRLVDQLIRAAYSIPSNIAESNNRNTTKEYINFLYTARGSANEVKYSLLLSRDLNCIGSERYADLSILTEEIIKNAQWANKFSLKEKI